jgi:F-type H+-transporting ATPase subunit alpha
VLPAVDVGKSVSRVGGQAQRAAFRAVAGNLKLGYAQFEELEAFSRFGARLDDNTRTIIEHGQRIRACLQQPELAPVPVPAQIAVLLALTADLFDGVPLEQMVEAERALREAAKEIPLEVRGRLDGAGKLDDGDRATVIEMARKTLQRFSRAPPSEAEAQAEGEEPPRPERKAAAASAFDGQAGSGPKPEPGRQEPPRNDAQAEAGDTRAQAKGKVAPEEGGGQ